MSRLDSTPPPPLPPSVEDAYRQKCVQLRHRTNEVDRVNDAARLRIERLKRQIEKTRLERAFLLEQLTRRTATNVEDSEGSPSPPPSVSLRIVLFSCGCLGASWPSFADLAMDPFTNLAQGKALAP